MIPQENHAVAMPTVRSSRTFVDTRVTLWPMDQYCQPASREPEGKGVRPPSHAGLPPSVLVKSVLDHAVPRILASPCRP
jgi:hypothetical protein